MASSTIPAVYRPVILNGVPCYDGASGDPVPVAKTFQLGCDKVVLIQTLPENTVRTSDKDAKLAHRIRKEFPAAAAAVQTGRRNITKAWSLQGSMLPKESC